MAANNSFSFALVVVLATTFLSACGSRREGKTVEQRPSTIQASTSGAKMNERVLDSSPVPEFARPHLIIYKMKGDYSNLVPISLAGREILSYPAPTDLSEYSTPIAVNDGYYIDRRGIGANTAFTRFTYQEYMNLDDVTVDLLLENIEDRNPFIELYDCGLLPQADLEVKANEFIQKQFAGCKSLIVR